MAKAAHTHLSDDVEANRTPPVSFRRRYRYSVPREYLGKNRDWVFSFAALRSNGFDCRDDHMDMWDEGWVDVPSEELDNGYLKYYVSPYDRPDPRERDLYIRGGQVLMKRSRELNDQEHIPYIEESNKYIRDVKSMVDTRKMTSDQYGEYTRRFQEYRP